MTIIEHPFQSAKSQSKNQRGLHEIIRWFFFGTPLASEREEHALVGKILALPIFCCDAISSVAYGGQQILLALCAAGLWLPEHSDLYAGWTMKITYAIFFLLVISSASYWQTIYAYPGGGGSYIVSRTNLGTNFGLVAGAALLIDYVLTAAVSVASGLQNLKDVPVLAPLHIGDHLVAYCLLALAVMLFANLRGLKESGNLFAVPAYTFIGMCYLMIVCGLLGLGHAWQLHPQYVNQVVPPEAGGAGNAFKAFGMAVVLRAFANGCSAMTGVEAVSNGIPSFKEPKSRNAALTLTWMAIILGTIFMAVSWLSVKFHVVYWEHGGMTAPAVIDQLSGMIFGKEGPWSWAYVLMQVSTALILIIAAQTSFAGFPRLASILARDGFLPRQLSNIGDRLAFNNGIIVLGVCSSIFIVMEHGSVDLLIPFFAIGVFCAFTLSQAGMVKHWFTHKGDNWQLKACINGLGAFLSFIVVIDIAAEKFFEGAWLVFVIMAVLLGLFKSVSRHYKKLAKQLKPPEYVGPSLPVKNKVLVLVNGVHAGTLDALEYARSLSPDCEAVFVGSDPERTAVMTAAWEKFVPDIPLIVLESPYRSLINPIMRYLDEVHEELPNQRITVIIAEFVPANWWENMLHGNTGLLLKLALLGRRDIVVVNVRYWLAEHEISESAVDAE